MYVTHYLPVRDASSSAEDVDQLEGAKILLQMNWRNLFEF
jgi:hypothetical protein